MEAKNIVVRFRQNTCDVLLQDDTLDTCLTQADQFAVNEPQFRFGVYVLASKHGVPKAAVREYDTVDQTEVDIRGTTLQLAPVSVPVIP